MNIMILWRSVPSQSDVSTNILHSVIEKLCRRGNDVSLVCFENTVKDNDIGVLNKFCDLHVIPNPTRSESWGDIWRFFLSSGKIQSPFRRFSSKMMEKCKDLSSAKKYDLIFFDQVLENYITAFSDSSKKMLYIIDPFNYSFTQYIKNERKITRKSKFFIELCAKKLFEFPTYYIFDGYVFVSEEHKRLLERYLNPSSTCFIVPQGVDTDFFSPILDNSEPNTILFTGNMSNVPNVTAIQFFFEKIYNLVKEEIPNLKVFLVGRKPSIEVQKYASGTVIIPGEVDDIREYFSRCEVVIIPIVVDDGGYKVKTLEAMTMGKACVSTRLGVKGLVVDNETILVADEPREFADKIISLLKNRDLRERIGKNARNHIEKYYSLKKTSEELCSIFERGKIPVTE